MLAGELALCEVLHGDLPRPSFPDALRRSAPPLWYRLAAGALEIGDVHARRGDCVAAVANLTQAVLATAQGRLAAVGHWALNEKRIIERAGLDDAQTLFDDTDPSTVRDRLTDLLDLPAWR